MQEWDPERQAQDEGIAVIATSKLPDRLLACCDHEKRIIWIAIGLSRPQRRSAVAYELGQLHNGPTPDDPCLARAYQRTAEEWAALMLIPSDVFVSSWGCCLDYPGMAAYCGVDVPTFRARIRAASDADQDAALEVIRRSKLSA